MTTEHDFQAALDANPDDANTRLVFADWLDERGDARAEGYRALGQLRLIPLYMASEPPWGELYSEDGEQEIGSWSWWHVMPEDDMDPHNITELEWYCAIETSHHYEYTDGTKRGSKDFFTRCEAENAIALAFAQLSPASRAHLLATEALVP